MSNAAERELDRETLGRIAYEAEREWLIGLYGQQRASHAMPDTWEHEKEWMPNHAENFRLMAEAVARHVRAATLAERASLVQRGVEAALEAAAKANCPCCNRNEEVLGERPLREYHMSEKGNVVACHAMFIHALDVAAIVAAVLGDK